LEEDLAPDDAPPIISSILEPPSLPLVLGNSFASQSNSSAESRDSIEERRGILLGVVLVLVVGSLEGETGILDAGALAPGDDDDAGTLTPGDDDDDALAPDPPDLVE